MWSYNFNTKKVSSNIEYILVQHTCLSIIHNIRETVRDGSFTNSPYEREVFYFVTKGEHQGGRPGLYFENISVSYRLCTLRSPREEARGYSE